MMVTFVSQCEKKALTRTRKVLDAFADRIGSHTWQTVITQEGLLAVKKSLRKTASKNTAVSCHWLRSRSRSQLLWVVGQRDKFNREGVVPVNMTRANILRSGIENNWTYLPLIKALVAMSGLLHDWGKASLLFQEKLSPKNTEPFKGDPIRHEWISCLLFNAFVRHTTNNIKDDKSWLDTFANGVIDETTISKIALKQSQTPLSDLPPVAKLLSWLIVSHHRLPLLDDKNLKAESHKDIDGIFSIITQKWAFENRWDEEEYQKRVKHCFEFPNGLLSASKPWLKEVKKWSKRLLECESLAIQTLKEGSYRLLLNQARLCLMLGDHYYSSQNADIHWRDTLHLFANTDRTTRQLKQKLDEHLVGVAKQGLRNAHLLPSLEIEPPVAKDIMALKKMSPKVYRWQDNAVNTIKNYLPNNKDVKGFFIVNMASTGCGKTFANAKVMHALSKDGDSLRFVLALGLRTLTLQTGNEYRDRVGLDDSELAVLIGSRAVTELHKISNFSEEDSFDSTGSPSQEPLLDEAIDYDCDISDEGLATVLTNNRDRQFLYAPVLACTIDHMMAATETKRGGRYILPTLRLMSSDLVIDEIDDFTGDDLIAIGRLIHLAGMLGRKVMISSATIPPDLAEGYFKAYRDGWLLHCQMRNQNPTIACVWIDEFDAKVSNNSFQELKQSIHAYREHHKVFIGNRVSRIKKEPVKRKAIISHCDSLLKMYDKNHDEPAIIKSKQQAYFDICLQSAISLHGDHHIVDKKTELSVSFGVIRVANINPCVALTRYLLTAECPNGIALRVMAYHSQQVLLMRHEQEQHLDGVLKRKDELGGQPQALSNTKIRNHLDTIKDLDPSIKNVIFILVATPVEEVGRDHDFDWAVIEPSSYRSIIQLAGRVRRHRRLETKKTNVHILQYNWRAIQYRHKKGLQAFQKPGFEEKGMRLESHDLCDLINERAINERLDATPRIQKNEPLQHKTQLADLEHYVTKNLLATYRSKEVNGKPPPEGPATLQGYLREPWFLTGLPPHFTPFRAGKPNINIYLVIDDDNLKTVFCEKNTKGVAIPREEVLGIRRLKLSKKENQRLWLNRDYMKAVEHQAEQQDISHRQVSLRYGELSFPYQENRKYEYSDQLGLVRVERTP